MRKLLLFVGLAVTVSTTYAQKAEKLEDVVEKIKKEKYDEAKEKLDKVLADPKSAGNNDAMYYKAVVYHNLAKQKTDSAMSVEALNAMKAYIKAEDSKPEAQRMLLSTLDNHKTLVDIYQTFYTKGVEQFQKNTYSSAFNHFENALDVFDILRQRKITNVAFDTTVTLYAGYSAQNAQMYDKAAKYYDVLINNNIADTTYVGIYRFMINSNLEKKDTVTAKKYLDLSRTRFPGYNDIWLDYQTLFLSADKTKRFTEYEELVKANPGNQTLATNYAIELYNHMRSSEAAEKNPEMREKAETALKNVLAADPNNTTANLLIAQLYWTELYQIQNASEAVKGATAAATAKKKEYNAQMDAVFDKVFPYLTKSNDLFSAQTTLRPQDKANYRIVLGQLVDYHNRKKQADKAAAYQAKLKTLQ